MKVLGGGASEPAVKAQDFLAAAPTWDQSTVLVNVHKNKDIFNE